MTQLQWRKEILLEAILTEIEQGDVMVENLKRLENLVEIIHKQGSKVPESVKKAYCDVAVDCTARCLAQKRDAKKAFIKAIRSIWLRRIRPLCDEVNCLVTRHLFDSCKRLWKAYIDGEAGESLMEKHTRDEALVSLRRVVSELHPDPEFGYDGRLMYMAEVESSQELEEAEPMVKARDVEVIQNSSADKAPESFSDTELEEHTSGESEDESPCCRSKTICVDRALLNALGGGGGPSYVNNETVTDQENDAYPSGTNTPPKLSSMEPQSTSGTSRAWRKLGANQRGVSNSSRY